MWTLCIWHSPPENPQPSSSSRRHQQAAGFLKKRTLLPPLVSERANKRKAYTLKIVPEDSISLISLRVSLIFYGEEDWSSKWRGMRWAEVYRSCLKKWHYSEKDREKHYWKIKRDFGVLHLIYYMLEQRTSFLHNHCWWQPCCWMTGILQWSTFLCTRLWHPTSSNMCGSQEKLGLVICFSSLEVKLQQLKSHSKVTSDSSLTAH